MRHGYRLVALLAAFLMLLACFSGNAETDSHNPLVSPIEQVENVDTPERLKNILLLGVDHGMDGYWGSYHKKDLKNCHTDGVMVVSVNQSTGHVNLISIPRDTLTYVPGVKGIYKLNAAINCSDDIEDGIDTVIEAVRWLLGGIEINDYVALDMPALIALGDAIGGVDMELEMSYTGHSGKHYGKGLQHLDGQGIMDYFRARTNATVNYNDLGRTNRQRETIRALSEKMLDQPTLIKKAWNLIGDGVHNIFTSLSLGETLNLAAKANQSQDAMGTYVLEGPYRSALRGWNFTFTDQQHRLEVLRAAFGIEAEEIPYVSQTYCKWLEDQGFRAAHALNVACQVRSYAAGLSGLTTAQEAARSELNAAYDAAIVSFDRAADAQNTAADSEMNLCRAKLRQACNMAAETLRYPDKVNWNGWYYWFTDAYVNEYPDVVWQ